jgi:hypothetical protein
VEQPGDDYAPSALPSTGARTLAFLSILLAGLCGGLIGYGVADVLDATSVLAGLVGVLGAVGAAVGVGIVATLALRASAEWRPIEHRKR